MSTAEKTEKARELWATGAKRIDLENQLGIPQSTAYSLIEQFKIEQRLQAEPDLLSQIKAMVEQGESRFTISQAFGLSLTAAAFAIKTANNSIFDDEVAMEDDEERTSKRSKREQLEKERKDLADNVAKLLDDGAGVNEIAETLGITPVRAKILVKEIRSNEFVHRPMMSKQSKFDYIDRLLEEGKSTFEVSRALDCSPATGQKLCKKVRGTFDLNGDSFRVALAKGATLKQLINKFGVKDGREVQKLIAEYFPEHMVYAKDIGDGDVGYTVIPDTSNHFSWLESNKEERLFKYGISPDNNYLFVQFDQTVTHAKIYNLTDVHVGHKHFDRQRFESYIQMIANDPDAFFVLGGDIFEWAHKLSVGDPSEQVLSPMEQVSESAKLLMPIAHKGIAYRSGNHDKGRGKHTGTDLAEVLAHYLKIPYFKVETVIQMQLGDKLFTVVLDHGHSGSSMQAILKDAEKYREAGGYFAHAHMSGHVHNSQIIQRVVKDVEPGRGIVYRRSFTVVGGSCLNYTGTYAEEHKYSPSPQDLTYFECLVDGRYGAGSIPANAR